jgi:hypothetical protein
MWYFSRCVGLHGGYTQLLPVSATNNREHHHQHASAEVSEGARSLPHALINFTNLSSALVSRLCDERPTLVKMRLWGRCPYFLLTNAPDKMYGRVEQLNIEVRYTQHP